MIEAIADLIVAIGGVTALIGIAGGSVYVAQRRMNGQKALFPGQAHDEEITALRDIETAIREGTDQTSKEHGAMMRALGFTRGHTWVPDKEEKKKEGT